MNERLSCRDSLLYIICDTIMKTERRGFMAKTAMIVARIEPELKADTERILKN